MVTMFSGMPMAGLHRTGMARYSPFIAQRSRLLTVRLCGIWPSLLMSGAMSNQMGVMGDIAD
jgi:hypothetical protein